MEVSVLDIRLHSQISMKMSNVENGYPFKTKKPTTAFAIMGF